MTISSVSIPEKTQRALEDLVEQTGESPQEIVAAAIEAYRRSRFIAGANAAYAALKADPVAWKEILEEREEWDVTLLDGLDDE